MPTAVMRGPSGISHTSPFLELLTKRLYVLAGVCLSAACSPDKPRPPLPASTPAPAVTARPADSAPTRLLSDSATEPIDIDSLEATRISLVSDIVSRVGPALRIRLRNGRTAMLKDDTTAGLTFARPRYEVYLRAIHSHVVHQYQYEGEGIYFVLDDSTGDSTLVFGMPVVSPDAKRFAITSMEGLEGGNPGVIEIWQMVGRKPEREFSYHTEQEPWEPSDARWHDSGTLDFFKNTHSAPGDPYLQTPGRLKRTGKTWALVESPH